VDNNNGLSDKHESIINIHSIYDTSVDIKLRILTALAISASIANTIGFIANFALYGMNIPTAFCAICALLVILNLFFGISSKHYMVFGTIMMCLLVLLEFPFLTFAYGPVMYPYMVLGFVSTMLLTSGKMRITCAVILTVFDTAVIIISTVVFPYIFGEQDAAGLLGSAVVTYIVSIITISICVVVMQSVYVRETSDIDPLTGALSHQGFIRMAKSIVKHSYLSQYDILYFNVKSFKAVNAVYGIDSGNKVLTQLTDRLSNSTMLQPKLTSRHHADHFVCLVEHSRLNEAALPELLKFKYNGKNKALVLQLECGIYTISDPDLSIDSMCDRARSALKHTRTLRGVHYAFYDEKLEAQFARETDVLAAVEDAIACEVFEPFYQPIVDCKTHKVVSAEALARWIDPSKGMISPGVFIPVLEQKELISDLDAIIASKVNRFLESRAESGKSIVPISVNLSRVDLYDSNLMKNLQFMVKQSRINESAYRFEVTESAYESLPENVIQELTNFRNLGAKILVDDFGSGYSSLGMITDYQFDIIKLDMKFASKIDDNDKVRGVICSLIELSHNLGAQVVAEGVETESQVDFLTKNGCDYIQGFYFYKPMSQHEFEILLDNQ